MPYFLNFRTLVMMASALALVVLCLSPEYGQMMPLWVINKGGFVADTLFHELGHTVFNWLFGRPAIPMIFTLFGADQAGGMTWAMERNIFVQVMVLAGLLAWGILCFKDSDWLYKPIFATIVFALAIIASGHQDEVVSYMGHGSSIAIGGFLLYRAWLDLDARNQLERWLNGFLGFYLVLRNMQFSYGLAFDRDKLFDYVVQGPFANGHHDFLAMEIAMPGVNVQFIATCTMVYCAITIIASFILAWIDDRN